MMLATLLTWYRNKRHLRPKARAAYARCFVKLVRAWWRGVRD